jgi:tRNA (cytidine/uridine-2'-O-)-methyltransferase
MNNLSIVLVAPEIPQNTGNIIRLCANMGADLSLVKPLGFDLDHKKLRRAHLYYDEFANVRIFENWSECVEYFGGRNIYCVETGGGRGVFDINFGGDEVLVFGSESSGLNNEILSSFDKRDILYLPMCAGSRSMNLANCVSICLYEAWRSIGFSGAVNCGVGFEFAN